MPLREECNVLYLSSQDIYTKAGVPFKDSIRLDRFRSFPLLIVYLINNITFHILYYKVIPCFFITLLRVYKNKVDE